MTAEGYDRINVQNNPVNLIDPYGLQSGVGVGVSPVGPSPAAHNVFWPGTPENDAFIKSFPVVWGWLTNADELQEWVKEHDRKVSEDTCSEVRQPDPSPPPGYDPENPPPDPNAPWWKKIARIIMDAIRAGNP